MGERGDSQRNNILVIILAAIIVVLLIIILLTCTPKKPTGVVDNDTLQVMDSVSIGETEKDKVLIVRVKNVSDKAIMNVEPRLIYFDESGMPFHEAWGSVIHRFEPGDIRSIEFYESIDKYSRMEVGVFPDDYFTDEDVKDLRDQITFETRKDDEPDEYGETRLYFEGKNDSNRKVSATFEIDYFSGKTWIFEDQFNLVIDANSSFDTYEYLTTEFRGGTAFPEGYTYEVKLLEAVPFVESSTDEELEEIVENVAEDAAKEIDVEAEIKANLKEYFDDAYGDTISDYKVETIKVYEGEEREQEYVDLDDKDNLFEIDFSLKPTDEKNVEELTKNYGTYNKDTGWIEKYHGYGVMRYNHADGGYDITSITPDSF